MVCDIKVALREEIDVEDSYKSLKEKNFLENLKICKYEFHDEYKKKYLLILTIDASDMMSI